MKRLLLVLGLGILGGILSGAAPPAPNPTATLAASLRALLLEGLPNPLYEGNKDWGKTRRVPTGINHFSDRNYGTWRKVRISPRNLPATLTLDLRDVQRLGPDRMAFTLFLGFDAQVDYEQQNWARGVRLYAGSVRARLRVKLALRCEVLSQVEFTGGLFPNMVFRLHVQKANLQYDNLIVEHFAGFGGTTAKVIGDMIQGIMKKLHPSLERRFLEKADAAIVKAGDTREIHLDLGNLLKGN